MLMASVPHHKQALEVRPEWYDGLLACRCAVLSEHAAEDEQPVPHTGTGRIYAKSRDGGPRLLTCPIRREYRCHYI